MVVAVHAAIGTDFSLSVVIMAVALATITEAVVWSRAVTLAAVDIGITIAGYRDVVLTVNADEVSVAWRPTYPVARMTRRTQSGLDRVLALARVHRWKKMLDDGRYGSVTELAVGEKLDRGYLREILMLTLLAPDVVEAILDGRQPA